MRYNISQVVYGRNRSKGPVGILLGAKYDDGVLVTGSKANISHGDQFNKDDGLSIAWDRQNTVRNKNRRNRLARSMSHDLERFANRCERYFRTENIHVPEIIAD